MGDHDIISSGNNVHVFWDSDVIENVGLPEILYRCSTDGGTTFGSAINLSNNPTVSFIPDEALSGTNLYVVWEDNFPNDEQIFFRKSSDSGVSFGPTANLSDMAGNHFLPVISASGNNVYIAWVKENGGVFFTRLGS